MGVPGRSKLFIDSGSGNVGIGINAPKAKLEVKGNLKLESGVAVNSFSNDATLGGNSDLTIPTEKAIKTYADTKASLAGSGERSFSTKNLTAMGNVGIGISNPQAKLHITGANATVNVETKELLRFHRPVVSKVKNSNSASISVGAFETGINVDSSPT